MTIKRIDPSGFESNTVIMRPTVEYIVSGSHVTGSIPLFPNASNSIKATRFARQRAGFFQPAYKSMEYEDLLRYCQTEMATYGTAEGPIQQYWERVPDTFRPEKFNKKYDITVDNVHGYSYNASSSTFKSGSLNSALRIIDIESHSNRNMQYGFSNYNSIGFISGSNQLTGSSLLYDQSARGTRTFPNMNSFVVSFHIKPPDKTDSNFTPGTIFQINDFLAVSIVSGSSVDKNGNVDSFKIVSQLTSSEGIDTFSFDYNESSLTANESTYSDFAKHVAYTSLSILEKNNWYHVMVAYGQNDDSTSFHDIYVDNKLRGYSAPGVLDSAMNQNYANSSGHNNPHVVIGNKISGVVDFDEFLNSKFEAYQKHNQLNGGSTDPDLGANQQFRGEVHEISMFYNRTYEVSKDYIHQLSQETLKPRMINRSIGISSEEPVLGFYLPVLFSSIEDQKFLRDPSGNTFTYNQVKSSHENCVIANSMRMPSVNISSFLGAFSKHDSTIVRPRCINLEEPHDITAENDYDLSQYSTHQDVSSQIGKYFMRNNLIRSCDNGKFLPNFKNYDDIITSLSLNENFLKSSQNNFDSSHVSMLNVITSSHIDTSAITFKFDQDFEHYVDKVVDTGNIPVADKNILSRCPPEYNIMSTYADTGGTESNLSTLINIPTMFYSKRIHPGTIELVDTSTSGSDGFNSYTLKDDGNGLIYRANSLFPAKYNKCGIVSYEHGLIVLTHPSLAMFGKDEFTVKFRGEHDLNVFKVNTIAGKYEFNKSVNPSYNKIGKYGDTNNNNDIVLISGIEYLDENLNVVMKSKFSQPIAKREFDEILFRSRIDF